MPGGYDPDCRRTMDWVKANQQGALWKLLRTLINLKRSRVELSGTDISIRAEGQLFIVERFKGDDCLKLTMNGGEEAIPLKKNLCTNAQKVIRLNEFMIEYIKESKEEGL